MIPELNADLGESWYTLVRGDDARLMPLLDSCNIACGFHAGDALTLQRTVALAGTHGVRIGAHPSFPDRKHFGRQPMDIPLDRLRALLLYQIGGLQAIVHSQGQSLHHLKPHGALYHHLNQTPKAAAILMEVARTTGIINIYGPPQGALRGAAAGAGLRFWSEGFADRSYLPDLQLSSRTSPGAILESSAAVIQQVQRLAFSREVICTDGIARPLHVDTICVHGDHPGAVARAQSIRNVLDQQQ